MLGHGSRGARNRHMARIPKQRKSDDGGPDGDDPGDPEERPAAQAIRGPPRGAAAVVTAKAGTTEARASRPKREKRARKPRRAAAPRRRPSFRDQHPASPPRRPPPTRSSTRSTRLSSRCSRSSARCSPGSSASSPSSCASWRRPRRRSAGAPPHCYRRSRSCSRPPAACWSRPIACAVLLALSQFADYRGISIGADAYTPGISSVAPAPEVERAEAGSAHSYLFVPIAIAAIALLLVAVRTRRWQLCRLVVLIGLAAIVVALLIDRPAGLDEGTLNRDFTGVEAKLLGGFWMQMFAGAGLALTSFLLDRRAAPRERRPRRPSGAEPRAQGEAGPGRAGGDLEPPAVRPQAQRRRHHRGGERMKRLPRAEIVLPIVIVVRRRDPDRERADDRLRVHAARRRGAARGLLRRLATTTR